MKIKNLFWTFLFISASGHIGELISLYFKPHPYNILLGGISIVIFSTLLTAIFYLIDKLIKYIKHPKTSSE